MLWRVWHSMRRRVKGSNFQKENRKIDLFLKDLIKMCKKHKMCLELDKRQVFTVVEYKDDNIELLQKAIDGIPAKKVEEELDLPKKK
jgi:hypothetical protein